MKCIVVKNTTTILTEVYEVEVQPSAGYPTIEDRAISGTARTGASPIASEQTRNVNFQVMVAK